MPQCIASACGQIGALMSHIAKAATGENHTLVGFVGCGRMGRPMLGHILARGHRAIAYDIDPKATAGLSGCEAVPSPTHVANVCEIVFGCLPTVEAFDAVVSGPQGVIHGKAIRLYVHLGTTGLAHTRKLAATLAKAKIQMLDAPISGGVARATDGTLASMVSGQAEAVRRARPLLECYSGSITEFGEAPGAAQAAKLINNMLSAANMALAVEGVLAGVKAGIKPAQLMALLSNGTGSSNALTTKVAEHVITRRFDWGGALSIVGKDMTAWKQMADELELICPLSRHVYQVYMDAVATMAPTECMTAAAKHIEHIEGVSIPAVELPRKS